MNYCDVEKKWQKKWADTGLYKFDEKSGKPKHYVLEMFSYPSGANLHIGHWYNYSLSDTYARFMRMKGYNVFHPMGFDAFGLPAENYAIKTGVHPQDSTRSNIATMEKQLSEIGATYDWDYELKTCEPDYYKWTQWCFLQLYKNGLAYRKKAPVNWCPSCSTVLANEQVVDGECERCGATVVRKNLTQWFFKITDYADRLLEGLDNIDWPEKTKTMQKNWIGKSQGGEIVFKVAGTDEPFTVFTTRADTLFGCTYVVISPEHPMLDSLTTPEQKNAVEAYKEYSSKASEIDRLSTTREKTGVFTGSYAINPINGRKVPIWTADYVLASYGTGIVMAVPAHDERDFEFAQKYGLPIERVINAKEGDDALPFTEPGILINSVEFDGLTTQKGKEEIIKHLKQTGQGDFKVNYRLRDWLISRQRYWGSPIPIIHCPNCGEVAVEEADLPVELPYDVNFSPDGTSPLAKAEAFVNVTCPKCGSPAKRDPDTMDTFVCSSWYYLRYPDNKNDDEPFSRSKIDALLPVDKYIGGAEHAVMHLLYARFFTKALHDMGYLGFDEPFLSLVHQGTILGADGEKMSKSRGNVVSPDELVHAYGSDTLRLYLAFGFNYIEGGPWNDDGVKGVNRFLERVARIVNRAVDILGGGGARDKDLDYAVNYAVDQVSKDIPNFSFNTAVARIMELANAINKYLDKNPDGEHARQAAKTLLLLLAPFAPHFAEEYWEYMGEPYSIFNAPFPQADKDALVKETLNMAFQINGKVKGRFDISTDATKQEIEEQALKEYAHLLADKQIMKKIVVPGSIVNIVVKK